MHNHPIIECELVNYSQGTPQWRFWCDYCQAWHHHGGHPDKTGEIGHRVAHCHVKHSPYLDRGYILKASVQAPSSTFKHIYPVTTYARVRA
jgi:hypothetical protein